MSEKTYTPLRSDYEWVEQPPWVQGLTVYETDTDPIFTGLYDQYGCKLYVIGEKLKIGFY